MSAVEYSLIFLSIVISYVVTVSMVSWGKLIKYYDFEKFSLDYFLWSVFLFLYLLFIWFWTFSYHLVYLDSYLWFTLLLIRPVLIYFCLEILIPEIYDGCNYKEHFELVKRKFFIILSTLWCFEIALSLLMGHSFNSTRGGLYLICLPISLYLVFVKNKKIHRILSIITFLVMLFAILGSMVDQSFRG